MCVARSPTRRRIASVASSSPRAARCSSTRSRICRYRKAAREFAADAMELLLRHSWPGNVRELDHAVERAVLMTEGGRVQARDLGLGGGGDGAGALDQMSLEEVERVLIQKALTRAA